MKVIIAGSRTFSDYQLLKDYCDHVLQNTDEVEIVSGGAAGADRLGERYAKEKGYPVAHFPALWDTFGKGAGYIRNREMAYYADALIAFWDGVSPGTKSMIKLAKEFDLEIKIKIYE